MAGIGTITAAEMFTEQVELEGRTTDPANAEPGEYWVRVDQTSSDPQVVAELRRQDTDGVTTIPLFDESEEANLGSDVVRGPSVVLGDGTVGFVAQTTDSGAEYGSPRVVTAAGEEYLSHNSLELSNIPDSGDNYEDDPDGPYASGEDLSTYYTGSPDLTAFSRTQSNVAEGSYAVENTNTNATSYLFVSEEGDGLPRYFSGGETISALVRDPSGVANCGPLYASTINASGNVDGYGVEVNSNNNFRIYRFDDDSFTQLAETNPTIDSNTYYWVEIDIPVTDTHEARIYEFNTASDPKGDQLTSGTVTATDNNHVGNSGHGGFKLSNTTGAILDGIL